MIEVRVRSSIIWDLAVTGQRTAGKPQAGTANPQVDHQSRWCVPSVGVRGAIEFLVPKKLPAGKLSESAFKLWRPPLIEHLSRAFVPRFPIEKQVLPWNQIRFRLDIPLVASRALGK